jgi:hypothetical protein
MICPDEQGCTFHWSCCVLSAHRVHPAPRPRLSAARIRSGGWLRECSWLQQAASQPAALRWPRAPMHVQKVNQHVRVPPLSANSPQSDHNPCNCYSVIGYLSGTHCAWAHIHAQHRAHNGAALQQPQGVWRSTAAAAPVCLLCQGAHLHPPQGGRFTWALHGLYMGLYLW